MHVCIRQIALAVIAVVIAGSATLAQSPASPGLLYAAPDIDSPALSPSGDRLAFIRHNRNYRGGEVVILDLTSEDMPV